MRCAAGMPIHRASPQKGWLWPTPASCGCVALQPARGASRRAEEAGRPMPAAPGTHGDQRAWRRHGDAAPVAAGSRGAWERPAKRALQFGWHASLASRLAQCCKLWSLCQLDWLSPNPKKQALVKAGCKPLSSAFDASKAAVDTLEPAAPDTEDTVAKAAAASRPASAAPPAAGGPSPTMPPQWTPPVTGQPPPPVTGQPTPPMAAGATPPTVDVSPGSFW